MRTSTLNRITHWSICFLMLAAAAARADMIEMQNGDRYVGKVQSMTTNAIVLESDVLGKINVPRGKVLSVTFGAATTTPTIAATRSVSSVATTPTAVVSHSPTANLTSTNVDLSASLRNLGANTNFIQEVRQQLLAGADPAAHQRFDDTVNSLMTGKMNLNDLRNQAKSSIDQINQLKRELGPEAGDELDSYLTILQNFVRESGSGSISSLTNSDN